MILSNVSLVCIKSVKSCLRAVLFALIGLVLFAFLSPAALAVSKEEVLRKYERMIVQSNELNLYGYDLSEIAFKLRGVTEILIASRYEKADQMMDDIQDDLKSIEARGPEHLQRERRLVWLEILGDLVQQLAIFVVLSLILLRFRAIRYSVVSVKNKLSYIWRLTLFFSLASIFSAGIGFVQYGQSSWSFIDLQVLFVALGGFVGGFWVGLVVGLANAAIRVWLSPQVTFYALIPLVVGVLAGLYRVLSSEWDLRKRDVLFGGLAVGITHSLFMYVPVFKYLPLPSFLVAVVSITVAEYGFLMVFYNIAWAIFREEKRKATERELMATRLRFLQAQINPHFLFNTLNTIAAVCGEERAQRARKLIIQLSTFFRRITKQEGDFVSLQDEFEYIDAYLSMEKARFGERLNINKDIQLTSNGQHVLVPILTLQPLVENAVKHGLSKKSEGGKLTISAKEEGSRVIVEIKDTGVGMSDEQKQRLLAGQENGTASDEEHTGIGFANIRERLSRYYRDQFEMSVESTPNQGTTIQLQFPRER